MDKNNKKIIWLGLSVSLFFFLIFFFTRNLGQNTSSVSPPENYQTSRIPLPTLPLSKGEEKGGGQTFLQIGKEKLETAIIEGENVYNFMEELQKEGKISFKDENYTGMGKFIEEINGVKNNGNENWIYYVNGKESNIGISNYKLNPGDVVSWKYENSI